MDSGYLFVLTPKGFPDLARIWAIERPGMVKPLMTERKISVSLSLRLYLAEHPGAVLIPTIEEFSTYVRTTYYQTPGFMSGTIPADQTAREAEPESNKEDLKRKANHEQ